MIRIRSISFVLTSALLASLPAAARAQYGGEGMVSGNGAVSISRQPERMRVQVALQGKGSTLKEALAAVKARGDAARKQLTALGADQDSIKIDNPKISGPQ